LEDAHLPLGEKIEFKPVEKAESSPIDGRLCYVLICFVSEGFCEATVNLYL
jgi:hypothetical protein